MSLDLIKIKLIKFHKNVLKLDILDPIISINATFKIDLKYYILVILNNFMIFYLNLLNNLKIV